MDPRPECRTTGKLTGKLGVQWGVGLEDGLVNLTTDTAAHLTSDCLMKWRYSKAVHCFIHYKENVLSSVNNKSLCKS